MKKILLLCAAASLSLSKSLPAVSTDLCHTHESKIAFNSNDHPGDLTGDLNASIIFAQSNTIPAGDHIENDRQPHLVSKRDTLLLVTPHEAHRNLAHPVRVVANFEGDILGEILLDTPDKLPLIKYDAHKIRHP